MYALMGPWYGGAPTPLVGRIWLTRLSKGKGGFMSQRVGPRRIHLGSVLAVIAAVIALGAGADPSHAAHPGEPGGLAFPVADGIVVRDEAPGDYALPVPGASDLAWDPGGRWLAYTVPGGSEPGLWVTDAAGCERHRLTTDPDDRAPAFTGTELTYTSDSGSEAFNFNPEWDAWVTTPKSAPIRAATDIATSVIEGYLAYVLPPGDDHPDEYVLMVDRLFEGATVEIYRSTRPIEGTEWAPDGSALLFEVVNDEGSLEVWRTDALAPDPIVERLLHRNGDVTDAAFSPDGSKIAYLNRLPGATTANVHVLDGGSTELVAAGATGGLDWQPVHPSWRLPLRPIATAIELELGEPLAPGWNTLGISMTPAPPSASVRISVDGVERIAGSLADWETNNVIWLDEGDHTVLVEFLGDCPYQPSSAEVLVEVAQPPAPTPPFVDTADSAFADEIAWAWRNGITNGCAPDRFCPKHAVTRGEMAAFLVRTLALPPSDEDWFADDDGHPHEDAINRIAAAGITFGCQVDRYCPNAPVPRDQMASFLARAAALPAASADAFRDDTGNSHEDAINRIAEAGITRGCGVDRYCPSSTVTREQMVAFLYRAFASLWEP